MAKKLGFQEMNQLIACKNIINNFLMWWCDISLWVTRTDCDNFLIAIFKGKRVYSSPTRHLKSQNSNYSGNQQHYTRYSAMSCRNRLIWRAWLTDHESKTIMYFNLVHLPILTSVNHTLLPPTPTSPLSPLPSSSTCYHYGQSISTADESHSAGWKLQFYWLFLDSLWSTADYRHESGRCCSFLLF